MDYTIGSVSPTINPDKGSGKWSSESWTLEMVAYKQAILAVLPNAATIIGTDAAIHMYHYLGNTGGKRTIPLAEMIAGVPSARLLYDREVALAKAFAETLPEGTHSITSARASNGYNRKSESWNWYFAIGGYSAWGKGVAFVGKDRTGKRGYRLLLDYRFYDRYNWDKGKSVTIFGVKITDEFMGTFHRQGLAQEFDCDGSVDREFTWGETTAIPPLPRLPVVPIERG